MIDPRIFDTEQVLHCGSDYVGHTNLYKTLVLLSVDTKEGLPLYFVVEGLAHKNQLTDNAQYFYETHSCPTNFIRIEAIVYDGDTDPHGVFKYVDSVWLTKEYVAAKESGREAEYLREVFKLGAR